ncbi:MAG: nucleotidyltransferase domain-containing protein [Methanocellales archaeon]
MRTYTFKEKDLEEKIAKYLEETGFKVSDGIKVRGMMADVVAIKDNKIYIVEVKGERGDISRGIEQVLHFKKCANHVYLALPSSRINKDIINVLKTLKIGLFSINDRVKERLTPEEIEPLPSVKKKLLKIEIKKRSEKKTIEDWTQILTRNTEIFRVLLDFPDRQWNVYQLSKEAKTSYATTWRCLKNLESYGIVRSSLIGKMRVFQVVKNSPYFKQIKNLMKVGLAVIENQMRGFCKELSEKFNMIKACILFGSHARGTAKPESDIDLLILTKTLSEELERRIVEHCSKESSEIGRKIMPTIMSIKEFKSKLKENDPFALNIKKEGVILYGSFQRSFGASRVLAKGSRVFGKSSRENY